MMKAEKKDGRGLVLQTQAAYDEAPAACRQAGAA